MNCASGGLPVNLNQVNEEAKFMGRHLLLLVLDAIINELGGCCPLLQRQVLKQYVVGAGLILTNEIILRYKSGKGKQFGAL
jgi:hypothetical protein